MTTSGVDGFAPTVRQIVKKAFKLINVVPATQDVSEVDEADAIEALNLMFQHWATKGITPWRKMIGEITAVDGQQVYKIYPERTSLGGTGGYIEYFGQLGAGTNETGYVYYYGQEVEAGVVDGLQIKYKPIEIIEARWVPDSGTEIPLTEIKHDEYFDIPEKSTSGTPTEFYYNRGSVAGDVYVWPTSSRAGRFVFTYNRRIEVVTNALQTLDVPQEWLSAVTYNLASVLSDEYGASGPAVERIIARAQIMYEEVQSYGREGFISFYPEYTV